MKLHEADQFLFNGMIDNPRYPDVPGHKVDGTSKEAGDSMREKANTLRAHVLATLQLAPMTADEVARHLGEGILSIRPRVSELVRAGKVVDAGIRRKNESGKSANVWKTID